MSLNASINLSDSPLQPVSGTEFPASPGSPIGSQPVDLHAAAESVRRMPEFQPPQSGPLDALLQFAPIRHITEAVSTWTEQLVEAIHRFLEVLRPPAVTGLPSPLVDLFSVVVSFILLVMLMYGCYIVLGWFLRLSRRERRPFAVNAKGGAVDFSLGSAQYAERAAVLASQADYSGAVRQLYWALLRLLDERGLVGFDPARTSREVAIRLKPDNAGSSAAAEHFLRLARRFEQTHYGHIPATATHYAECETAYREIENTPLSPGQALA